MWILLFKISWKFSLNLTGLEIWTPLFYLNWSIYKKYPLRDIFYHGFIFQCFPLYFEFGKEIQYLFGFEIITDTLSSIEQFRSLGR